MRLKVWAETDKIGSLVEYRLEVNDVKWDIMDDKEKQEFVLEQLMLSVLSYGWEKLNEKE
jgi:hypothetical protein